MTVLLFVESGMDDTEQPQCLSCKVISDSLPFAGVGYMIYHTVKYRRTMFGWQRTKLYIVNGMFTASKCFLLLFTACSFGFSLTPRKLWALSEYDIVQTGSLLGGMLNLLFS